MEAAFGACAPKKDQDPFSMEGLEYSRGGTGSIGVLQVLYLYCYLLYLCTVYCVFGPPLQEQSYGVP